MFIELTDHLRCPAEHEEQFLVLVPAELRGRDVWAGSLGCPVCQRNYPVRAGVAIFGTQPGIASAPTPLDGEAQAALAGLGSPGGYVVLVGGAAARAPDLAAALPGVALVLVNPPDNLALPPLASCLVAPRLPLKQRSMRAVILGSGYGDDRAWITDAARVVLPGNRGVGEGSVGDLPGLALAATAGQCWVATKER